DVGFSQGGLGDRARLARRLGGEVGDVRLIVRPQGGDAQALLGFAQAVVGLDTFRPSAELLHLPLEHGGGGFKAQFGGGLLGLGHGGRHRQQRQGGGQGQGNKREGADHDEAPSTDAGRVRRRARVLK